MKRRDFLKFGTTGLAVVAVGTMADWPVFWRGPRAFASSSGSGSLELNMVDALAEMVDGVSVPMWAFRLADTDHAEMAGGARIPGPVLVALEGDRIRLRITNSIETATSGGAHGFAIPGVDLEVDDETVSQVIIPPGDDEVRVEFTAPAAGTYMYLDPLNAPVNRVMGLHGVLVVLPNPVGNNAPYSGLSFGSPVQRLFDDLGSTAHFPGNPWDSARNAIWVFNVIDPDKAAQATASAAAIAPSSFLGGFLPQYFTINGKSGFFSAQHGHGAMEGEDGSHVNDLENTLSVAHGLYDAQGSISLQGTVGQPILIRNLNAGLMWQSPHIHGNHVYPVAHARINADNSAGFRYIATNVPMLDTWLMQPGDIWDVLLPYIQPPDIPAEVWPPVQERFPMLYPMHDHNEISNTAAGANYPQGAATHWQIDAPFDPNNPATGVISIDLADLRVKTGQLLVKGRFTVPNVVLDIHAGGANGPTISRTVRVDSSGNFAFRGRALKAMTSRFITMMHHDPLEPSHVHATRSVPLRLI